MGNLRDPGVVSASSVRRLGEQHLKPCHYFFQLVQEPFWAGDKQMSKKLFSLAVFRGMSQAVLLWKHLCFTSLQRGRKVVWPVDMPRGWWCLAGQMTGQAWQGPLALLSRWLRGYVVGAQWFSQLPPSRVSPSTVLQHCFDLWAYGHKFKLWNWGAAVGLSPERVLPPRHHLPHRATIDPAGNKLSNIWYDKLNVKANTKNT